MQVSIPEGATLAVNVRGVPVLLTHDALANGSQPHSVRDPLRTVELLIDRTSIEAFANQGEVSISRCFLPTNGGVSLKATGGLVTVESLSLFQLKSAWNGNAAFETAASQRRAISPTPACAGDADQLRHSGASTESVPGKSAGVSHGSPHRPSCGAGP